MNISEVLAKVSKGEELNEADKEFMSTYSEPNVNDMMAAVRKKEREKFEKKQVEYESTLAELKEQITASTTDDGKDETTKALEALNKKYENQSKQLQAMAEEKTAMTRKQGVDAIKSGYSFVDGVSQDLIGSVFNLAFKDVDLTDEFEVGQVKDKLFADNPGLFVAPGEGGAGRTPHQTPTRTPSGQVYTRESLKNMSSEEYAKNREAITKAVAAGEVQ